MYMTICRVLCRNNFKEFRRAFFSHFFYLSKLHVNQCQHASIVVLDINRELFRFQSLLMRLIHCVRFAEMESNRN